MELTVLLAAVRVHPGVTIVGDVNQKIVPEADFGWDALARELGIAGASVTKLEVAHRSTTAIMAVADLIIGDTTPPGRPGPRHLHPCRLPDREARARRGARARGRE